MKRTWSDPKLIVLRRGKMQEAVILATCDGSGGTSGKGQGTCQEMTSCMNCK